jgi:hypothetical protein
MFLMSDQILLLPLIHHLSVLVHVCVFVLHDLLSTLPANYSSFPQAPAGEVGSFRVMPESTRPPSSFDPSLERTGPRLRVRSTRPLSTLPANYSSFPQAPAGEVGSFRVMPESTRTPVGVGGT